MDGPWSTRSFFSSIVAQVAAQYGLLTDRPLSEPFTLNTVHFDDRLFQTIFDFLDQIPEFNAFKIKRNFRNKI